jgi:S-DNA-T family DNA segregation ATPase FtsK/SpoIIIE
LNVNNSSKNSPQKQRNQKNQQNKKYQDKPNNNNYSNYVFFILIFIIALGLFYFFLYPNNSGILGKFFYEKFAYIFGKSIYLIPLFTAILSFKFLDKNQINHKIVILGFLLLIIFTPNLIQCVFGNESGGLIGGFLYDFLLMLVGKIGVYLISIFFILLGFYFLNFEFVLGTSFLSKKLFLALLNSLKKKYPEDEENEKSEEIKTKFNIDTVPENKIGNELIQKDKKNLIANENENINLVKQFESLPTKRSQKILEKVEKEQKIEKKEYVLPPVDLLDKPKANNFKLNQKELKDTATVLQKTLQNFGIDATVSNIIPGPVITRYEVELAPGVKVGSVVNLKNDICLAMKAQNIMILAPIPGKAAVGIEVPNINKEQVVFREFIESAEFRNNTTLLPFALGKTVSGKIYITDIAKTPHLLIAGSTGSGKSVCINTLIMSILFAKKPDEVKFIMVDPKVVELSYYKEIPHLYNPVITNPKEASKVLQQIVFEMEQRYEKYAEVSVRNIESYNEKMLSEGKEKDFYLVVIIDELADLMLVASKDVEESIVRLTQKARAVGIHVVLATQRPSVNVITGIIKANLPSRISFQVISKTDSRVILDSNGAEDLLGKGDMLFLENGSAKTMRMQGAFLSEAEVQRVIKFVKTQSKPDFTSFNKVIEKINDAQTNDVGKDLEEDFKRALNLVFERKKVSYELLRANSFSGPKATNIISLMEMKGFIEKPVGTQKWEIDFEAIEKYISNCD